MKPPPSPYGHCVLVSSGAELVYDDVVNDFHGEMNVLIACFRRCSE